MTMPSYQSAAAEDVAAWLTIAQAARYLGISEKTIRRRIDARDIPVFRDGGIIRIKRSDLDRYINDRIIR
jgi:excisionase family DNA binding protein